MFVLKIRITICEWCQSKCKHNVQRFTIYDYERSFRTSHQTVLIVVAWNEKKLIHLLAINVSWLREDAYVQSLRHCLLKRSISLVQRDQSWTFNKSWRTVWRSQLVRSCFRNWIISLDFRSREDILNYVNTSSWTNKWDSLWRLSRLSLFQESCACKKVRFERHFWH